MPEKIGQYKIEKKLGEGGMGAVYLGVHALLRSRAAIKTILHSNLESEEAINRLIDEGQALASLAHHHIVRVLDLFAEGSRHYLVMEYVEGDTLDQYLKKESPDLQSAITIAIQVGEGIAAAHRKDIMHRDIKPANVMLTTDGTVKVMDFGLAKFAGATTKTRTGFIVGTPRYMSPEQVTGSHLDHRSDQYSYGVLLYRLFCGREPFMEGDSMAIVYKHIHEPPASPTDWNPELPNHLVETILCSLNKAPEERFQDMDELLVELRFVQSSIADLPSIPVTRYEPVSAGHTPGASRPSSRTPTAPRPSSRTPSAARVAASAAGSPGLTGGASAPRPAAARPTGTAPQRSQSGQRGATSQYGATGMAPAAVQAQGETQALGTPGGFPASAKKSSSTLPIIFLALFGFALVGAGGLFFLWKKGLLPGSRSAASGSGASIFRDKPTPLAAGGSNGWVRIDPPPQPVPLGIGKDDPDENVSGFRPARKIASPTAAYEIQRHEVTWGELDGWMASHTDISFVFPAWVPAQPEARRDLPVAGIPWRVALSYCTSLQGSLPTEEQWEYAARGPQRRPWPWGDAQADTAQTALYQSAGSLPHAAESNPQDKTPGDNPIYDLAGNVQEWTIDYWRENQPGQDESYARNEKQPLRAIRGLPFAGDRPDKLPAEGAAARDVLCGEGQCVEKFKDARQFVGFRCVHSAP